MEYYLNELDSTSFQRLINAILVEEYGDEVRLTPLRGADGGRDAETAPGNPHLQFQPEDDLSSQAFFYSSPKGRYLFQDKHHSTVDKNEDDARGRVVADFETELKENVLTRSGDEKVNYFFLITNVPSSKKAIDNIDRKRKELLQGVRDLHADVWWKERISASLDKMPQLWRTWPQIFAGGKPPFLASPAIENSDDELPPSMRLAITDHYRKDSTVRFKQIRLDQSLAKLFVDVSVRLDISDEKALAEARVLIRDLHNDGGKDKSLLDPDDLEDATLLNVEFTAMELLLDETSKATRKMILEGGPGQGKSTVTQMATQVYRQQLLQYPDEDMSARGHVAKKVRIPFRIDLRAFGDFIEQDGFDKSVEQYITHIVKHDSGGSEMSTDNLQQVLQGSPVLLVFDGLDEIGNDDLRDIVLDKIVECVSRLEDGLHCDVKVVVTTRPPAIAGRRAKLANFSRITITPMSDDNIDTYVRRWLAVQLQDPDDRRMVWDSFSRRRDESHVRALARNPMQLSVLLHLIYFKGEAFPDRRSELYKEYFDAVIDRDVEKNSEFRKKRPLIELLHQFLGYKIHALTEVKKSDGTLPRKQLISAVSEWLQARGDTPKMAAELFKLGEERLGLIVANTGEGEGTRYGYEIQPIREYFAAAFINEQIHGNANQVFAEMIRRPFWREVALFLAGLRRSNEKADLVLRAIDLDKDAESGWRQDGRTAILELLNEGVLSEPPHVFRSALDSILNLLDPSEVRVQNSPPSLIQSLPILLAQDRNIEGRRQQLLELIKKYNNSDSEYCLKRLYDVAFGVLPKDIARKACSSYKGISPELIARVRLQWPAANGIDMSPSTDITAFWDGASDRKWGEAWWNAGLQNPAATHLDGASHLHMILAEELAIRDKPICRSRIGNAYLRSDLPKLAVWRLVRYLQIISEILLVKRHTADDIYYSPNVLIGNLSDVDFSGLDTITAKLIRDLLALAYAIANNVVVGIDDLQGEILDMIDAINRRFADPGLNGWIAYRCMRKLITAIRMYHFGGLSDDDTVVAIMDVEPLMHALRNCTRLQHSKNVKANWRQARSLLNSGVSTFPVEPIPVVVCTGDDIGYLSISSLLLDKINKHIELPFEWIDHISFSPSVMRAMLLNCKYNVIPTLSFLGSRPIDELRFSFGGNASSIVSSFDIIQETVLSLARESDDEAVMAGVLAVATVQPRILKHAEDNFILTLLQLRAQNATATTRVFSRLIRVCPDRAIGIADTIVNNPERYCFELVTSAARFLANQKAVVLPSILEREDDLGLTVKG